MDFLRTIGLDATLVGAASQTTQRAIDIGAMLSSDVTLAPVSSSVDRRTRSQQPKSGPPRSRPDSVLQSKELVAARGNEA